MRLFLSTGEASGDRYGAALITEMKAHGLPKECVIEAVGGQRVKEAGAKLVCDSSAWGAIGIAQALRIAPRAAAGLATAKRALAAGDPGLLIPIDFGFFNVRLARFAKRRGWKVLYFLPPGAWRRTEQGKDLASITDAVVTPFPWSYDLLLKQGVNAKFFGHPLRQLAADKVASKKREVLAVLPGSRRHEIDLNLPLFARALKSLDTPIEFGVAPTIGAAKLQAEWMKLSGRQGDTFRESGLYELLSSAKAAVVCSGTATLEAALCKCPMVVVYQVSRGMYLEALLAGLKGKRISLPNILLDRDVVPEFAGPSLSAEALREAVEKLLLDESMRREQLQAFDELDKILGPDDAIRKTASLALAMAGFPERK